jgi:hypothetical protein
MSLFHDVMVAQLFETAIVLGFMGVDQRVDDMQDRMGRRGAKDEGQRNGGGKNVSHE